MAKKNSIDQIVENLVDEFSKIQNFQLTQEDEVGKKFFSFAISIAIEFNSFQTLFIQYYLPASRRSILDTKREIKQSSYKHLISIPEDDFMENYYETIRLGYVGAYHKYENFMKRMVSQIDAFFKNLDEEDSIFILKNAYINTDPATDESFGFGYDILPYLQLNRPLPARMGNFIEIDKHIVLENVQFSEDENVFRSNLSSIIKNYHFKKSVTLTNVFNVDF